MLQAMLLDVVDRRRQYATILTILGNLEADASGLVIRKEDGEHSFDYGTQLGLHAR